MEVLRRGAFAVLIPDNLKPVVTAADPITPHFSDGWLDYSSHVGFVTDPRTDPLTEGQTPCRTHGAVRARELLGR